MAVYNLSPIFQPQYVANAAAALVFATPGAPTVVPAGFNYQIATMRVTNVTGAPVSLTMSRVPNGGVSGGHNLVLQTINIPVASNTTPWMDLTLFWGDVLQPGDSIVAAAGSANALVVQGDGAVIQI